MEPLTKSLVSIPLIACLLQASVALAGPAGESQAQPASSTGLEGLLRVGEPGRLPDDSRLGKPRNLDSYHPWTPITDPAAFRERARRVRERVLVAAGLWPMPEPAPLQPVIHGTIDRDGYVIQKVFFQSWPGFYVTGNLYRPLPAAGRGGAGTRLPAVLCPHGHWRNGRFFDAGEKEAENQIKGGKEKTVEGARFPLQARCAQLARMGCVVFHYDMVGYADSTQISHSQGFTDAEAELRLQSFFGLQTYNSIRALEFLSSLPEVDPARIGVTGASGGGTQTFILCAVDDRPAVAFPAVMVSTGMQGGCVCENASCLRVGTGNIELAALCAPRPLGMTGANDWTLEIETKGLPELKALYSALGVPDRVMARCFPAFEHNYNQVSRELMYGWMNRHLHLGLPEPIEERPFKPVPPSELSVFDAGHPRPADAVDAAELRRRMTAAAERQMALLRPFNPAGLSELRRVVGTALEVVTASRLPRPGEVEAREAGETTWSDSTGGATSVKRLFLARRGGGETVPAVWLSRSRTSPAVVVLVHPGGKAAALAAGEKPSPLASAVLASGAAILALDPFLTGEYHPAGQRTAAHPVHDKYAGYSFGYNRALLAERVHDILTAVGFARERPGVKTVHLVGLEGAGPWALIARAMLDEAAGRTFVDLGRFRFEEVRATSHEMMLPGALRYGGLPAFAALAAPGELLAARPPEGMDLARQAYAAAGAPERLRLEEEGPDAAALAAWLLR